MIRRLLMRGWRGWGGRSLLAICLQGRFCRHRVFRNECRCLMQVDYNHATWLIVCLAAQAAGHRAMLPSVSSGLEVPPAATLSTWV